MMTLLSRKCRSGTMLTLALLIVGGCSEWQDRSHFTVRIQWVQCSDDLDSMDPPKCKGRSIDGGVYDFRLFPNERRALVRVVKFPPGEYYDTLFDLTNCVIWDANNWRCDFPRGGGYSSSYELREGKYTGTFVAVDKVIYYVGAAQGR